MAELVSIKRNVDVSPGQAAPAVFHCSQGDVGSKIILGLLNNGTAYAIPSGVTVTIEGSESNGSIFTPISATASGSDITFYLTGEMTAVAGPAICQAVLKSGSNILGTANFTLEVESSPMGADAPPVFTDAGWTWMLNKLTTEFVPALGDNIIDAIDSKADQSDLTALSNTVAGHTGSITVLNNTVNNLNRDVTKNRQNIATKLDKNQGTANAGKYLKVGTDGNVTTAELDVTTDKTLSIADKSADAKAVGDELDVLKADLNAIQTATSEDVGKALKAKTVTDSKVTEWEFGEAGGGGGEDYYTETPSPNLCDSSEWTDTATTAPLIPVEYGKTYSTNLNAYGFSTYCYDANKTSLGANNAYSGVVVTKGNYYDGVNFKYTVEVVKEAVAYIQYRIAKPTIPPMFLEGDVDIPVIPIAFDDTSLAPVEPALGNLKSVMLSNHKVARAELDADLSNAIKVLGYSDKVVQASDIYNFDASTSELLVYDGVIQGKEGITAYSNAEFLLFDSAVNRISYDFRSGTSALSPWVIVKDNFESEGRILSLSASGMSYLYSVSTEGTVSAKDNSFAWTAENPLVSVDVVRNVDNVVLTFVDSTDTEIVKTYTFAQLRITGDAGRMGMYPRRSTATIRNKALACVNLKISAKSSISGGGSSASRLAEKTWDAWGDSFTAGDSSYPSKVATAIGCTATNLGQSGDKVATVLGRFNNRSDACGSYVTVFAGVNDFLYATALETFKTNVQSMITAVIAKAPSSKFGWVIPPQTAYQQTNSLDLTLEDYDDAIIEICRANSVPVLDLYHEGGWYTNSAFTSIYIGGDGLHPSAQGQALLADKIQMFLERL